MSGCVGNRAAVFPLQTLGFDADFVNTVQFSNHTGYPVFKGSQTSKEQLQQLVDGLETNGTHRSGVHCISMCCSMYLAFI